MGKIIVTGTGRCGTSFLMLIFTFLDLNTGFKKENFNNYIDKKNNSGLEVLDPNKSQQIVKFPGFMDQFDSIIKKVDIERVIIPIRSYEESAISRCKNNMLWHAKDEKSQIEYYYKITSKYMLSMVEYDIPTIFLDFKRMITSPKYLYNKLLPILKEISFEKFKKAYELADKHQKKL